MATSDDIGALRAQTLDDVMAHLRGEIRARRALAEDVAALTEKLDTLGSPLWKRIWWRIDGYQSWWIVERRRDRRPWHWYGGPERRKAS